MSDLFIYIRKNKQPSKAVPLSNVMAAARARLANGMVDYHLRKNTDLAGPALSRPVLLQRMRNNLLDGDVGLRLRVYSEANSDGSMFTVHKVQPSLVIVDISGNSHADLYYSTVIEQFRQYHPRYAGSYVCKDVAGTTTLSQHSYGNAVDFFFDTLDEQDVVADWAVANRDNLHIHTVISRQRIWTLADGWHAYGGDYHSHLHTDYDPQFSGPCGVREP